MFSFNVTHKEPSDEGVLPATLLPLIWFLGSCPTMSTTVTINTVHIHLCYKL